jgi:hypothetical protein
MAGDQCSFDDATYPKPPDLAMRPCVIRRTSLLAAIVHGPDRAAGMTSQPNQESTMHNQIANTEIRALSDDEMNEVSGGTNPWARTLQLEASNPGFRQALQRFEGLAELGRMRPLS